MAQRAVGELGDLTGHLDTGRPGSDDDEGEQLSALLLRVRDLGRLEGTEDPAAQLEGVVDGLHARRMAGEVIVAEVRLPRARRDEQRVVGGGQLLTEELAADGPGGDVDVGDLTEDDPRVSLTGEDLPRRRGDLSLRQDAGGDLIQQGLEQVVRRPRDEGDVDIGPPQGPGEEEPAEAGSDDDDAVPWVRGHTRDNDDSGRGMPEPASGSTTWVVGRRPPDSTRRHRPNEGPDQSAGQGLHLVAGQDLNLRPPGYEPGELPNCSPRRLELFTQACVGLTTVRDPASQTKSAVGSPKTPGASSGPLNRSVAQGSSVASPRPGRARHRAGPSPRPEPPQQGQWARAARSVRPGPLW